MDEEVFDDDQNGEDEKAKDEIKDLMKDYDLDMVGGALRNLYGA